MEKSTKRIILISDCEQCHHYNFDDGDDERKWGKRWCEELGEELVTSIIPDYCPLFSVPSEEEINAASNLKEQYHLKGLFDYYGTNTPTSFAAMCCGNSFDEGVKFILKKIKRG